MTSAPAARLKLSRDDVEARLGIRFEEYWDGAEFVGFRSFGLAGIGRVALAARAGRDDVELHFDTGAPAPTLDRLAAALGLVRDELA